MNLGDFFSLGVYIFFFLKGNEGCGCIKTNTLFFVCGKQTTDGSLYFCFENMIVPSEQSLSVPCLEHLTFIQGSGSLGDECQLTFSHRNMVKLSYSSLMPGDIVNVAGFKNLSGGAFEGPVRVESPPFSLTPLVLISGPTDISIDALEVCWNLGALRTGGRGVTYDASRSDPVVVRSLTQKSGVSGERLCVEREDWDNFDSGSTYTLTVDATSSLFGTIGSDSLTFFVREGFSSTRSVVSSAKRQQESDCADLWDEDPLSMYGIQTYPSGNVYLASSVRLEGLTVLLKALTPCEEVAMSREILELGSVSWEFVDHPNLDANEYSLGTRLFLPSSLLQENFAPYVPVVVDVSLTLEEGVFFSSSFSFQFVPGPVKFVLSDDPGSVVKADSVLVLDFTNSFTEDQDRMLVDSVDLKWEWGWGCVNPVTGDPCTYQNGDALVMPGQSSSVFVSALDFSVGDPMLFVVYAKAMSSDGGWVSRGEWSRVLTPVESAPQFQLEYSEWWCLFGNGQYGYNVCFSSLIFFLSLALFFLLSPFWFLLLLLLFLFPSFRFLFHPSPLSPLLFPHGFFYSSKFRLRHKLE